MAAISRSRLRTPRFARVPAHDLANGVGLERELGGGDAVRQELLGDQILFRDSHFLLVRVPGQGEDLHPVTQRAWNGIEGIGGGDEQHL
jgi:hypothetical protein